MKLATSITMITAAVCTLQLSFAQVKPGGKYTLKGKITGLDSGMVYLAAIDDQDGTTDSVRVNNGAFTFTGTVNEPRLYSLKPADAKAGRIFFLESGTISVEGTKDSIYKAVIKGSPTQDVYTGFYSGAWKPVTERAGDIYRRLDKAHEGKKELDTATRKAFDKEFAVLEVFNDSIINAYVKQHAGSPAVASIILERYINYQQIAKARKLFPSLNQSVQQSFYGKQIAEALAVDGLTAPGQLAPDFTMKDTSGKAIKLSSLKGRYVLVDFWASWCGPCRKENPNVVAAYKKFHEKGFDILGVSLDSKKEAWLKAIKADGLSWYHVSDLKGWANEAAAAYGVKSVPASFLLDRSGHVVARNLRGEDLEKKLSEVLP